MGRGLVPGSGPEGYAAAIMVRRSVLALALACALVPGCAIAPPGPVGAPYPTSPSPSVTVVPSPSVTPPPSPMPKPPPSASARPTPTPTPTGPPITGDDPVTLAFAGDIHFEEQLRPVARRPDGLASLRPHLSAADVTVVNLETAITERGTPLAGKAFTFRAPASALGVLADAGVDVVSVANNHGVDFGDVGLSDTLAAKASAPVAVIGVGADADEAFAPATFEVDGVRVAILTAMNLNDETTARHSAGASEPGVATMLADPSRMVAAVERARAEHDVVVAFLHYGRERIECPEARERRAVELLQAAGADAIVGGHSHRVQAGGWSGSTYVNYGLGNFVWWRNAGASGNTGVLTIEVDKERVRQRRAGGDAGALVVKETWVPFRVTSSGIPEPVGAATAAQRLAERDALRGCSGLDAQP